MNDYQSQAEELVKQGVKEVKKSGEDWMEYIEEHPIQSMLFGVAIYYAIRGFFK